MLNPNQSIFFVFLNPNDIGGGQVELCEAKFSDKCLCSHHNITHLIQKKYLFLVLPIVMTNNKSVGQTETWLKCPPPKKKYN